MRWLLAILLIVALSCGLAHSQGMNPVGGITVTVSSSPEGVTVTPTWSFGESVLYYNTTSGIDPYWNFGESVIRDIKE